MGPKVLRCAVALAAVIPVVLARASAVDLENPWMDKPFLNIAHQGGAKEAPSNTLYAFKEAIRKGADVLELDVHATADRHLVILHDSTLDRTTNGQGRVDTKTLSELKALDAAYWWSPGFVDCHSATCDWTLRGVATGDVSPPASYSSNDFTIPTLREVFETFPGTLINIEIKNTVPDTIPYERELSDLLKEFDRTDDVIVVSFLDHATEAFKAFNFEASTATGTGETAAFWASAQGPLAGAPNPRYHALQVPVVFSGITVVTPSFVQKANANNLAVHVWTIDTKAEMCTLIGWGVQGIMTDRPGLLESIVDGTSPC